MWKGSEPAEQQVKLRDDSVLNEGNLDEGDRKEGVDAKDTLEPPVAGVGNAE